jgi:hypothetical protein
MLSGATERTNSLVDIDMPDTAPAAAMADAASSHGLRRRLVGAGLIGLAGSLLPSLASRAGASPAPTTTAPPKRPTDADLELLRFAQSAELAAQELYTTALAGGFGEITTAVVTTVRDAHMAYGQALSALIGKTAPGTPLAELVEASTGAFTGPSAGFLAAALELENTLVTTHTELLGQLQGIDAAKLIASVIVAESHHAVVFADLGGATRVDQYLANETTALAPAEG